MRTFNDFSLELLQSFAEEHLAYEFKMLLFMANLLSHNQESILTEPQELSQLESFLIHARLLDDFFCPQERRAKKWRLGSDDVLVANYLPEGESILLNILPLEMRKAINKQVAHLCVQRDSKIKFPVQEIARSACLVFKEFHGFLDADKRPWFMETEQQVADFMRGRPDPDSDGAMGIGEPVLWGS